MKNLRKILTFLIMCMVLMVPFTAFAGDVPEGLLSEDGAKVFYGKLVNYDKEEVEVSPFKVIKGDMDEREWIKFKNPQTVGNFRPLKDNVYLFAYFDDNNPIYVFNVDSYDTKTAKLKGIEGDMWARMQQYLNEGKFEEANAKRLDAKNSEIKLTGEKITLAEFLNIKNTADIEKIYICNTEYTREEVALEDFLPVAEEIILEKTKTGAQSELNGIYVDVHRIEGQRTYAFISEKGEVDNYFHIYSRLPARQYMTSTANIKKLQDLVSPSQGMPRLRRNKIYIYLGVGAAVVVGVVVLSIVKKKKKKEETKTEE